MTYYVYVLLCKDGSFYTGQAKDVNSRFKQHKNGIGARYTRMHKPVRIVYMEKVNSLNKAMRREKEIKRLSHEGKRRLARI